MFVWKLRRNPSNFLNERMEGLNQLQQLWSLLRAWRRTGGSRKIICSNDFIGEHIWYLLLRGGLWEVDSCLCCSLHKVSRCHSYLDAFVKLPKATFSFVATVCLSVRPHDTSWFALDGFLWNLVFDPPPRKSVEKIQVLLKCDNNNGYFAWRPIHIFDHLSLSYP